VAQSKARRVTSRDPEVTPPVPAYLTINSRNYGSWSLRGWLLCRFAGLPVEVEQIAHGDETARAELLLLAPSFLTPRLVHDDVTVWDTLAIAEYLAELRPEAGLLPADRVARAHCRSVAGEMHAGFANVRSALPMDIRAHFPGFRIYAGARADIERIQEVWTECLETYGGPFLFGDRPTIADAMYAPVCTRFATYDVQLDARCAEYCETVLALPAMVEWMEAAASEAEPVTELEVEF
jgi:glutathione S-transferase